MSEPFQMHQGKRHEAENIDQEITMQGMDTKERRVGEGEKRVEAVMERVMRQRERHRERSVLVRAGVVVAGGAVSVFAAPLSLVVPELGLPLLLFGLRLLALEFDRAARLYVRVEKLARKILGFLKRLFKSKRNIAIAVVIGIVVAVAVRVLVL